MRGHNRRGQTTLDFAFGMSIFIAVVLFIFLFVPGILEPFTAGVQEETVTTNRVADELTHGLLGSTRTPKVLNRTCTVEFFADNNSAGCNYYDATPGDPENVTERIGLDEGQNVNVTVYGNVSAGGDGREVLCWDDDADTLVEQTEAACDTGPTSRDVPLKAGDSPPMRNDDSVSATRVVSLFREDVTVEVVMW